MSHDEAWNASAVDLVKASRAHCWYFMLVNFMSQLDMVEDEPVKRVLTHVCTLFALSNIAEDFGSFELSRAQKRAAKDAFLQMLPIVRADVVPLMDAWEFPDNVLNSALGRHDGRVYESLYAGEGLSAQSLRSIHRVQRIPEATFGY